MPVFVCEESSNNAMSRTTTVESTLVRFLKHKFKLRFFIDESVSFGTLGDHGKGITEYAGLELNDIDLIMATLEYSAGSIGGFCVGTTYVVEHQGFCSFDQVIKLSTLA